MTPKAAFEAVWQRYDALSAIHAYLTTNVSLILNLDELLRAEWVGRVSALDLFVHELVAQYMLEQFRGIRPPSKGFLRFRVSYSTLIRVRNATTPSEAEAAFDLEIRSHLTQLTFQHPDKIADGVRLISDVELWNEVVLARGATQARKAEEAKTLKGNLAAIVDRRNKIAHEGDFGPSIPRTLNPIDVSDLNDVRNLIISIVDVISNLM